MTCDGGGDVAAVAVAAAVAVVFLLLLLPFFSLSVELDLSSVRGDTRAYLFSPVWG